MCGVHSKAWTNRIGRLRGRVGVEGIRDWIPALCVSLKDWKHGGLLHAEPARVAGHHRIRPGEVEFVHSSTFPF